MPRLIVPSNGGGTKLMRTLLAGDCEGVCAGAGPGVSASSGEMEGERDSSTVGAGIGVGDSWAKATEAKIANRKAARLLLFREFREIPRLRSE